MADVNNKATSSFNMSHINGNILLLYILLQSKTLLILANLKLKHTLNTLP